MTKKETGNRPTHRVHAVIKKGDDDKGTWREIGALWPHKDGKGFSMKLDLVPLGDSELVIRAIEDKQSEGGAA